MLAIVQSINFPFYMHVADFWVKHEGKNCYTGKGAVSMMPNPYGLASLSDCQNACETDNLCEGIIFKGGPDRGWCHKRMNIKIDECNDQNGFDLFIKATGKPFSKYHLIMWSSRNINILMCPNHYTSTNDYHHNSCPHHYTRCL